MNRSHILKTSPERWYPTQEQRDPRLIFLMFEEWDYCLRIHKARFNIVTVLDVATSHLFAGSTGNSSPWRGYYQTRNHLAMVLERRSMRELFWWGFRQVKFSVGVLLYLDSKRERLRFRALGAWPGFRGRLGRTPLYQCRRRESNRKVFRFGCSIWCRPRLHPDSRSVDHA